MVAKSTTLKQAVADPVDTAKEVKGEVVKRGRGRPPKEASAVDLKAAKQELNALKKQANSSEKEHLAALKFIDKEADAKRKEAAKPMDEARAAKAAALKAVEKAEAAVAAAITKVNKDIGKIDAAAQKERDKLIKAKDKADGVLAKEIARLSALVGE